MRILGIGAHIGVRKLLCGGGLQIAYEPVRPEIGHVYFNFVVACVEELIDARRERLPPNSIYLAAIHRHSGNFAHLV